jgi:ferric-dicitrate binding protein FerR (iron transport regulator)
MTARTRAHQALPRAHGAQGRHRRADQRKRRGEKLLAVLVLAAAFVVTVVLVGWQWLGNQATASPLPANAGHPFTSEVLAS